MSSILDALKKVEDEKMARQAAERANGDSFQPEAAAAELVGDTPADGEAAIRISRRALILGVIALVTVVLGGTIVIMSMLRSSGGATPPIASDVPSINLAAVQPPALPTPEPISPAVEISNDAVRRPSVDEIASIPPTQQPAPSELVTPEEEPVQAVGESVTPLTVIEPKVSPVESDVKPVQVASVAPTPAPSAIPSVAPVTRVVASPTAPDSSVPQPSTAPPPRARPVIPEDIRKLPPLRSSERARFGLEGLKINMLREPSPNRPRGSVIINLKKVYLDDFIPGTTARLVSIATHGIAIQVGSERELYFVAN